MKSTDHRELRRAKPFGRAERFDSPCASWGMLLPEAAEGLLSESEQLAFEQHLTQCPSCSVQFAEAQRGLAWLTLLKDPSPEPPEDLLANILAQTSGMAETGVYLPTIAPDYGLLPEAPPPEWEKQSVRETLRGWLRGDPETWSALLQPRLAMTGAMAFLSICLTLNLLSTAPGRGDAETLHGAELSHSVSRTGSSLIRSWEGLRFAYRVESRVRALEAESHLPEDGRPGR